MAPENLIDDIFSEILAHGIFFGACLGALLAGVHLAHADRSLARRMVALVCFCVGVLFLYMYGVLRGFAFDWPLLNHLFVPFVYALGPANYCLFRATTDEGYRIGRSGWLFGLALLAFLALIVLSWLDPAAMARGPAEYFTSEGLSSVEALTLCGWLSIGVFYLILFRRAAVLFTMRMLRAERSVRALLAIFIGGGVITAIALGAYLAVRLEWMIQLCFWASLYSAVMHIFAQGVPELFDGLAPAMQEARRGRRLAGLDLKDLGERLRYLMEEEQIYVEEDLSLNRLADLLDVKAHQLSEYINTHLKQNFSRMVNGHRAAAAARILLEEPDAAVLAVAFRVGFNSKANFNLAFKGVHGVSPREYIRRHRAGSVRKSRVRPKRLHQPRTSKSRKS